MRSLYLVLAASVCVEATGVCYWNAKCPFQQYSTKTPYDTVRGDIRDSPVPKNCKAVSFWTLIRHGNRNPQDKATESIKNIALLKDDIIASFERGRSQLCAQDIQNLRKWSWNKTLEVSQAFLTDSGYQEMYGIASRLREKYPHILQGAVEDYNFKTTNGPTIASGKAFINGFTEGTNLTLTHDNESEADVTLGPYLHCDRYQTIVKPSLLNHMHTYLNSAEFIAVRNAVQRRLDIETQLSSDDILAFYDLCRFDRSWITTFQSPWCAAFSDHDLEVLEYRDDVRRYYKNGYGSWISSNLGYYPLKDLYDNFEAHISGKAKKLVSYFVHLTLLEMVYCALGLYKDAEVLMATCRDPNRLWKSSHYGAFAANIIAVLNSCQEAGSQSYRVQLFINEKETELCPLEGCIWQQFQDKFQVFKSANLEYCSLDYKAPESQPLKNGVTVLQGFLGILLVEALFLIY